jgi:hypothetical protein
MQRGIRLSSLSRLGDGTITFTTSNRPLTELNTRPGLAVPELLRRNMHGVTLQVNLEKRRVAGVPR